MRAVEFLTQILSLSIIAAETICCLFFFDIFLIRKDNNKKRITSSLAIFAMLFMTSFLITLFFTDIIYKSIAIILSYLCIIIFFYQGSILKKFIISLSDYFLILLIDFISVKIQNDLLRLPGSLTTTDVPPFYFFLAATFSKTALFLVIILIKNVVIINQRRRSKTVSIYYCFVYFLQGTVSLISILSLIVLSVKSNPIPIIAIIATFGLLYLNNTVFGLLEKASTYEKNVCENALYRQQVEAELININVLIKSINAQRAYLHDYKNYLSTIYQLINECKYEAAQKLISSISDNVYLSLYRFKTNHEIIDAVLNQKFIEAEDNNITLDIRACNLSKVKIEEQYLVTILANAIDNAIEETKKVTVSPTIIVKLIIENNVLIFSVINPIAMPVRIVNNMVESSKKDKTMHGIGLKNISIALQKCNGDYELGCDNNHFQFTALIHIT